MCKSGERVMRVKRWESKVLRLTLRPRMKAGGRVCGVQENNFKKYEINVEKDETARWPRTMTMPWATYAGDVLVVVAPQPILGWRTPSSLKV